MGSINVLASCMITITQKEADHLVRVNDIVGYAINTGPVETRTPIYDLIQDCAYNNCYLVLTKWIDDTGIYIRYYKHLVVLT
jgi:hypothetical protein